MLACYSFDYCRGPTVWQREKEDLLDAVLALLRTSQQLRCRELHHQLEDVFEGLSKQLLLHSASDGRNSFAPCKRSVVGSLNVIQRIGDTNTQRLSGAVHAFCDTDMTADWPGNVCKSVSTTDTVVLLLTELVTGKPWLAAALRRRLMSFLQLQVSDTESRLSDLWVYMSEALQVFLRTLLLNSPRGRAVPSPGGGPCSGMSSIDRLLHLGSVSFVHAV